MWSEGSSNGVDLDEIHRNVLKEYLVLLRWDPTWRNLSSFVSLVRTGIETSKCFLESKFFYVETRFDLEVLSRAWSINWFDVKTIRKSWNVQTLIGRSCRTLMALADVWFIIHIWGFPNVFWKQERWIAVFALILEFVYLIRKQKKGWIFPGRAAYLDLDSNMMKARLNGQMGKNLINEVQKITIEVNSSSFISKLHRLLESHH